MKVIRQLPPTMSGPRPPREPGLARRGVSLVEVAIAISLVSAALGLIGVLLHGAFRADRSLREHLRSRHSLVGLAAQFRDDAHEALSARVTSGGAANAGKQGCANAAILFTLPDGGSIEYQTDGDQVVRQSRRQQQAVHRESFALHAGAGARWRVAAGELGTIATMSIQREDGSESSVDSVSPTARVEATVGSNSRFIRHREP